MPTVPDLNPTPAPKNPIPGWLSGLGTLWTTLAGKRTIVLSTLLGITKAVLPLLPAGSAVYEILSLFDTFIPVLIPVTLHLAITNNGNNAPVKPA